MNIQDLSYFFNKYILHIKPDHTVFYIRTIIIGLLSAPATREYYEYISNENLTRFGPNIWLALAILLVEVMLFFRNYDSKRDY